MMLPQKIVAFLLIAILATVSRCDEHDHSVSFFQIKRENFETFVASTITISFQYSEGEEVVVWMNTVGPYHNRQETYAYFSLPFCQGPKVTISHYHETLGEALQGTELEFSGLQLDFKSKHRVTNVFCNLSYLL